LQTKHGPQLFATGDRVQFTGNAASKARRDAGLFNGAAGTIRAIDGEFVTVALDAPKHAPARYLGKPDMANYHLFQPLLYQVATAALSPGDIAVPIRSMFLDQFNTRVLLGNVTDIYPATTGDH
jgi:hypothetical protein